MEPSKVGSKLSKHRCEFIAESQLAGVPLKKIAEAMGTTQPSISQYKKRPEFIEAYKRLSYHLDVLEGNQSLEETGKRLIELRKSKTEPVALGACKEILAVHGAYAPKQLDVHHTIEMLSDDEIDERMGESIGVIDADSDGRYQATVSGDEQEAQEIADSPPRPRLVAGEIEQGTGQCGAGALEREAVPVCAVSGEGHEETELPVEDAGGDT
jgi:hypothetical protein